MLYRLLSRGALCAAVFVASVTTPTSRADTVQFSASPDTPMVALIREHGMMRGVVDTPLVLVFGDGRVVVDRPAYMLGAGLHEFKLDADALNVLVRSMAGLVDVDTKAVAQRRNALERAAGERFVTLDQTVTHIKLRFDALGRNGAAARGVDRTVSLANVQIDAERYGDIAELTTMARAEQVLLELFDRPLAAARNQGADNE